MTNPVELMERARLSLLSYRPDTDPLLLELDAAVAQAVRGAIPLGIKGGTMSFDVIGVPRGQGNMIQASHGKIIHRKDAQMQKWRRLVAKAAEVARGGAKPLPKNIPVAIGLEFRMPNLTRRGVKSKTAIPGDWCVRPSDVDKLTRAVMDAMTGVVWKDDSQVVAWLQPNGKRWIREGEQPGCRITVAQLG